jgi:hypothetical protein
MEKLTPELVEKLKKNMKLPDSDLHYLEMAVLQYLFLDCGKKYKKM